VTAEAAAPGPGAREPGRGETIAACLEQVCQRTSTVPSALARYGHRRLGDLAAAGLVTAERPYQPRRDLCEALVEYATPLLGAAEAEAAAAELDAVPVVLTANHHGVDFFAQSVQGTLIFALARAERGLGTVPVLAVGTVALNNVTYPRGLLLYGGSRGDGAGPARLPLFPSRLNRTMVSAAGPIQAGMIDRAAGQVRHLRRSGAVPAALGEAVEAMLQDDYRAAAVLQQPSYARQAVLLNRRVWQRLFFGEARPRLVYLEMEQLVTRVLEKDVWDPASLACLVLFQPAVRERLVEALDGERGCWERGRLAQRMLDADRASGDPGGRDGCGTQFFWGVDDRGRRVPLWLDEAREPAVLCGITDARERWDVPCVPSAIAEALRQRRLLPSLFTCFAVTALARGITCLGGYYQAAYLPAMQAALVAALESSGRFEAADLVRQVPAAGYLSGMQAVMTPIDGLGLVPAGPAEIAAAGGLGFADRRRMLDMTVRDAHAASLFDTVEDVAPDMVGPGWRETLAREVEAELSQKVVIV
jgi:hypothetical protein